MSGRAGCAGAGSGNELDRPRHHAPLGLVELGLGPVQVDTWGPFVFVNADLDAPPLADSMGALPALIEPDALVFRERVETELATNWKVAVENYLECYHCPTAHRVQRSRRRRPGRVPTRGCERSAQPVRASPRRRRGRRRLPVPPR